MPYRIHRAALTTLAVTLTGSLVAGAADARAGTDKEARATIRNLAINAPML